MLTRWELFGTIVGAWILAGIPYGIIKRKIEKNGKLLPGSIITETTDTRIVNKIPGTPWSKYGVYIGMGVTEFVLVSVVIICLINQWDNIASMVAVDFPRWLNWIGICGFWLHTILGFFVVIYNINYTPVTHSIPSKYILATGGPYRFIRHPMYINKAILVIFVFMATGIWFVLFGFIAWFALPSQAKAEEELMRERFGRSYEGYYAKTGRFFPKFKRNTKVSEL